MSLALLDTIILREVIDAPYTTKGSELTFSELDTNIIILADAVREVSQIEVSGISPFDAGEEYSNVAPDYVTYGGNTWEYINAIPSTGVTPVEGSTWTIASSGAFSHQQNTDTTLAIGTSDAVTAAEIRAFIDAGGSTSDAVYGALWNGVTTIAPSKNAVYDKIELLDSLVVHLAGTETITGAKTFSLDITMPTAKGVVWVASSIKEIAGELILASTGAIRVDTTDYVSIGDVTAQGVYVGRIGTLTAVSGGLRVDEDTLFEGDTRFNSLTASTVVYLNASKDLVSLANGTGALTNNGSGTLSYVQYQPLDSDLTSWAGVTRASGFDTFVATPSSANLASLVADETGSGALVFATSPALVTPNIGTPSAGVLTNCTGLPKASVVGYQGYTLQTSVQAINPADGVTYYTGVNITPTSVAGEAAMIIPRDGTIKRIDVIFTNQGTTGSNEASTVSFRLNNTTDTTISNLVTTNATRTPFSNAGLSIAVVAGDTFEIKWVAPTYATNPTQVRVHSIVYIE